MLAKKYKHIIPLLLLLMVYTGCEKDEQTGQQPEEITKNKQSTNIQLEVYGFNNQKGNLAIAVFNNINSFDSESSAYLDSTVHINSTDMSVFLENINPGEYAISVFHDADESGDITFGGFLNLIPQEGFGFSNNPNIGMSQPSYNECKFTIDNNQPLLIPINLVYL